MGSTAFPRDGSPSRGRSDLAGVGRALLALTPIWVVVLQRVGMPLGPIQLPVVLPIVLASVGVAAAGGVLVLRPARAAIFSFALGAVVAAALLTITLTETTYSLPSLAYLLALYVPFLLTWATAHADVQNAIFAAFIGIMAVASLLGLVQFGIQLLGVPFFDPLAGLPEQLSTQTNFIESRPLAWESSLFKPNALFFVEASFFSQFAALAIVLALQQRCRLRVILVLIAGLIVSLSGTGLIMLGVGMVVLLTIGARPARVLVPAVVLLAMSVTIPGLQDLTWGRVREFTQPGSSAHNRFVEPYVQSLGYSRTHELHWLLGSGPGSVERILGAREGGEEVVYPALVKSSFEYGLPVGAALIVLVVIALAGPRRYLAVGVSSSVMLLFLSGSLLQPHTVLLAWVLTGLITADAQAAIGRSRIPPTPARWSLDGASETPTVVRGTPMC